MLVLTIATQSQFTTNRSVFFDTGSTYIGVGSLTRFSLALVLNNFSFPIAG